MAVRKDITWTVENVGADIELSLSESIPPELKIEQGTDLILMDLETARDTHKALGELISFVESERPQ